MRKGDSTQYVTSIQNQFSTYDNQNDNISPPTCAFPTGETPQSNEIIYNDDANERGLQVWCERQQKNKPQSNSIAAGIMMLLYSGLHIGWGVYRLNLGGVWHKSHTTRSQLLFIILVFYFGSKLGAFIGHYMLSTIKKTNIYYFCDALNIISSIAFMAGYDEIGAIFVGRIFAGLAYGICYMTVIVHASENCIKEIRGLIVTSINYIIIASLITVTAFDNNLSHPNSDSIFNTDFWVGLIGLCYTIIGILCAPFLTYESVIFLIIRGKNEQAIKNMIKLRNESMETLQIRRDYEEIYQMIEEDKTNSKCVFENNHGIYLLLLTQLLAALSTSMAINLPMLYIMYLFININYGIIMVAPRFN